MPKVGNGDGLGSERACARAAQLLAIVILLSVFRLTRFCSRLIMSFPAVNEELVYAMPPMDPELAFLLEEVNVSSSAISLLR